MRKILFRGKRLDNGDWVEGYLYEHEPPLVGIVSEKDEPEASKWFIARTGFADWNLPRPVELVEVDPSTVGQYTGLKDKNGKRIFEGDLVQYNTFDDFSCCSAVKFGEYDQDGSSGEYTPSVCVGWYVEVCGFTCPDWAEDDPIFFKDCQKQQNLLEVNEMCEVIGNIHDDIDLLGGKFYDNE